MLIRPITLWPWSLTSWSWTCVIDGASCGAPIFYIWTWSVHPPLSYWRLTTDFSSVIGGAPKLPGVIFKTRGKICTKLGGTLSGHCYTGSLKWWRYLAVFQTKAAQSRALLSDKAKNRTFDPPPPCKNFGRGGRDVWVDSSSCTDDRTSVMHLLAGLAAAAKRRVLVKKIKNKEETRKRGNCKCIATWGSPTSCSPYPL